jgi:hypothetical protein
VRQALRLGQRGIGRGDDGREVGRGDDQARAGVGDVVAELLGPVHRVDGHHHRVGAQHRVHRHQVLRAVLQEHRHAVALAHALGLQPAGQGQRLRVQLAPAHGPAEEEAGGLVG